ncbi:citrate:proton symporter [Pseudomonas sp. GD03842]|uniref:CitMHS family transporter n=1 Tax=Pseudomonas sp. GD03842 TaxID=2975385 RepID=UPI002448F9F9|nr:citrate:proton symporter [Pseudomonas sp. GD03842]MDH0745180.1 citrate:proton symporter [Pseudomonas sp. GD03842]
MLITLSCVMLACFIYTLMSKRLSALTALILIPSLFALIGGFHAEMGKYVIDGLKMVAPNGVLMIFAMLYFLCMTEAGMFDPLVARIVGAVRGDPVRIFIGTVALAFVVALDGDGATIYMIVLSAFLPIYHRLGLSRPMVCCLLLQVAGLGNMMPWGGPTARAATAMHVDMAEMFVPLLPALLASVVYTFGLAWWFGRRERTRLGGGIDLNGDFSERAQLRCQSRWRLIFNWTLTAALLLALCLEVLPLSYLFMIAACLALIVNFPTLKAQQDQLALHAPPILAVAGLIFAAGVFTGILGGTGMANAVADGLVKIVPSSMGPYMAVITALLSIPVTWLVSNDVFYFGILPILAQTAQHHGITAVEMARASLIGQPVHILSPLVASTYLVVSMLKLDYAENQRFTMKWSVVSCLVLLLVALLTGVIPLVSDV